MRRGVGTARHAAGASGVGRMRASAGEAREVCHGSIATPALALSPRRRRRRHRAPNAPSQPRCSLQSCAGGGAAGRAAARCERTQKRRRPDVCEARPLALERWNALLNGRWCVEFGSQVSVTAEMGDGSARPTDVPLPEGAFCVAYGWRTALSWRFRAVANRISWLIHVCAADAAVRLTATARASGSAPAPAPPARLDAAAAEAEKRWRNEVSVAWWTQASTCRLIAARIAAAAVRRHGSNRHAKPVVHVSMLCRDLPKERDGSAASTPVAGGAAAGCGRRGGGAGGGPARPCGAAAAGCS